jgi:hypothetical protein
LATFRGIYSEQPNALAANFDRVAVDHTGHASDLPFLSECSSAGERQDRDHD